MDFPLVSRTPCAVSPRRSISSALHLNLTVASAVVLIAVAFAAPRLTAQYPSSPNGAYANPYPQQYAQPSPQYAQPQVQQPQYAPQQPYAQPQYQQPQYQQPQYAPQQPYDQQPSDQQPYASASPYPDQSLAQPAAAPPQALSAGDLEQLLAPIALYPDALLAQILAASTYPAQVAVADQWLQQMRAQGYGSPDQVAAGATAQTSWDPSVKSLTAFPDVLDMLNHNLQWTTNLGDAYYNQPQDVMQTVQVLRQRAQQAGNLQSTPQEDVTSNQGYIDLAPANPEQVYVPTYNPWDVYGQPISPYPGFSLIGALGSFFGAAPIQYGLSFALGAFDHTPFGLLAWGFDWLANSVLFNHADYYSRSTSVRDWGLPRGGPRAYGRGDMARAPGNYNRGYGSQNYGNGQRGNFAGNTARPGNFVRPAVGAPYQQRTDGLNRAYQPSPNNYAHPALPAREMYERSASQQAYASRPQQQAYSSRSQVYPNRAPTYASRPQQSFSNPGYGYGYTSRSSGAYSAQAYAARPGSTYASPYSSYRAPQSSAPRAFDNRSYSNYGNSMARNERSGGFHPFSHEQEPKGFSNYREPKNSFKAPKSFGGGGHEKAPKMSHSSGGGGGHHR